MRDMFKNNKTTNEINTATQTLAQIYLDHKWFKDKNLKNWNK